MAPRSLDIVDDVIDTLSAINGAPSYYTDVNTVERTIKNPHMVAPNLMPWVGCAVASGEWDYLTARKVNDTIELWIVAHVNELPGRPKEVALLQLEEDIIKALHLDIRRGGSNTITRIKNREFDLPDPNGEDSNEGVGTMWMRVEIEFERRS